MKDIVHYTSATMDPNTAEPSLIISEDLIILNAVVDRYPIPNNPERLKLCPCVLGSGGFGSGSHCWDVEVGNNECWDVGVTTESNQRKSHSFSLESVWCVSYSGHAGHFPGPMYEVKQKLHTLRVHLDLDREDSCHSLILFFSFFSTFTRHPISILPMKPSVTTEQHT